MEFPWLSNFLIEGAEGEESVEDKSEEGTDTEDKSEEDVQPEQEEDVEDESKEDTQPEQEDLDLVSEVEDIKKQIEELKSKFSLEKQVEDIQRKLDNININNDPNLNDSIYQSASMHVRKAKRDIRRIISKKINLTGRQKNLIMQDVLQNKNQSIQEIALRLSKKINACDKDIADFIRFSDFRFQQRHLREN